MSQHTAISEAFAADQPPALPSPRRQRLRKLLVTVLCALFCGVIVAYWIITDPQRVRELAEAYLSQTIGGHCQVERASLSIFEGLRLEGVQVDVDDQGLPDSRLFSAKVFLLKADPRALLSGHLESTQIMALEPQVHLCENLDSGQWNYMRLQRPKPKLPRQAAARRGPLLLPEILLRAGGIEYSRIAQGRHQVVGALAIDGRLTPVQEGESLPSGRYAFDLQGRAPAQPVGPRLRGILDTSALSINARLENFEFDRTVRLMLPSKVQQWWEAHQLAGQVRIPSFRYAPGSKGQADDFRIEVELQSVSLAILPEELMGRQEFAQQLHRHPGFAVDMVEHFHFIGRTEAVERALRPQPIALKNVSGRMVFTPRQIRFSSVRGRLANNRLTLDGAAEGYDTDAAAMIRVVANDIDIPRLPRFLASLPGEVRKEYLKYRPTGRGDLAVEVRRRQADGPVEAKVELSVLDGAFCFDELSYPLRNVRGRVAYGRDPVSGIEWVHLRNLQGRGIEGTRNQDTFVKLSGWVAPLNRISAVDIRASSTSVWLDEPLRRALPHDARQVLAMFDPGPHNPLELHGSFEAHVHRPKGFRRKLNVDVDLAIDQGRGAFEEFPYPLRNISGLILIRPGLVRVCDMVARHGGSWIWVNGPVHFGRKQPVKPELDVVAHHIPVDQHLRRALPRQQQKWLQQLDLAGTLKVVGRILRVENPQAQNPNDRSYIDFVSQIDLANGRVWPAPEGHLVTDLSARMKLSRSRLVLEQGQGRHQDSLITGQGDFAWPEDRPEFSLNVRAENLLAHKTIHDLVPASAQRWWQELRPSGRANLSVHYSGGVYDEPDGSITTRPPTFSVEIEPRGLSIQPLSFPWKMESDSGMLRIGPHGVSLADVPVRHGNARILLNGSGGSAEHSARVLKAWDKDNLEPRGWTLGPWQAQTWSLDAAVWQLRLSGESLQLDDELRAAVPKGLGAFFKSIDIRGIAAFDTPQLVYRSHAMKLGSQPLPAATDLTFRSAIRLADGAMEAGVPLSNVQGLADLNVGLRDGQLLRLDGTLSMPSAIIAARPVTALHCNLKRLAGANGLEAYRFTDIEGRLAGGRMAGKMDLFIPRNSSSWYEMALGLKDVEVRQLSAGLGENLNGTLSGSLDLAGSWDNPASRRGTGVVKVEGKELYRVPLLFGLLQLANLNLPINSPINEATARYSLMGQRIVLTPLELRSRNMIMEGNGFIDFETKNVDMIFTTDNPAWKIPFLNEVARNVFQIRVTGNVTEHQVNATPTNPLTTTVDLVFSPRPAKQENKKKSWW